MREIKFRAWVDGDTMIYLDQVRGKYDFENGHVVAFVVDAYEEFGAHERYNPRQMELMQFTGLTDKNGKEIYEGDIIRIWTKPKDGYDYIAKVSWVDGGFEFHITREDIKFPFVNYLRNFSDVSEVIGNIYENPELLNSEQNPERSVDKRNSKGSRKKQGYRRA